MLSIREIAARHQPATDARAIGACEYGIRSWCARTGISYEGEPPSPRSTQRIRPARRPRPAPSCTLPVAPGMRRECSPEYPYARHFRAFS